MKNYLPFITATENRKGVFDIDSVKGCTLGMSAHPDGGCYGLCYAAKMARAYGYDFTKSISRRIDSDPQLPLFNEITGPRQIVKALIKHDSEFFRIGTMGDPSHDWTLTAEICEWLGRYKTPVVITKHWVTLTDEQIERFAKIVPVFNTSVSALDTEDELHYRLGEYERLKERGIRSMLRIVSCRFGDTERGRELSKIQDMLFSYSNIIDNPLRIPASDSRVLCGDILVERRRDLAKEQDISIHNHTPYVGGCKGCPDQCGAKQRTDK
jgi:hypothetical protein